MEKLKIAQIAPLYESVPPRLYGGTERVVSYLTEELVHLGHDVTLFASGDSVTNARLVPVCRNALRLDSTCRDQLAHHVLMLQMVLDQAEAFDIIHYHIDYLHFPLSKLLGVPHITTLHGRLDIPDLNPLYQVFDDVPLVSISESQRKSLPNVNWVANVYHGLPPGHLTPSYHEGQYLAFLGRVSAEKGLADAIDIAIQCEMPIRIAAKIDKEDNKYFDTEIAHRLAHPLVEFLGEIGERDKNRFLGDAAALLFPIAWPEPFGLAMVEALACGTPVIAFGAGSVPEIIRDEHTGFIVNDQREAIDAVRRIGYINRWECRRHFERHFTASAMASGYIQAYNAVIGQSLHTQSKSLVI